jgi:hypothetical protein
MPTTGQALRCIEHLLQINPQHGQALEEREVLRVRMLLEESALKPAPLQASSTPQHRYLLGEALVEARVITTEQLQFALERQRQLARAGNPTRLGRLLLDLGLVRPLQLEAAIAAQREPQTSKDEGSLGRIGTYLLRRNIVTLAQIHQGLARQRELQAAGRGTKLGEVLVDLGYVSGDTLTSALRDWEREYESCFY